MWSARRGMRVAGSFAGHIEEGCLLLSVYLVIALGSSPQKIMDQVPAFIVRLSSTLGHATRWPGPTQKFARVPQASFGFGTDAPYKLTGGDNV